MPHFVPRTPESITYFLELSNNPIIQSSNNQKIMFSSTFQVWQELPLVLPPPPAQVLEIPEILNL